MTKEEAQDILELLEHLRAYSDVEKILSTFMSPFFEKSTIREDNYYLHGSFHLGGTKSGRLSSSQPNLQQLPSTGSPYAKTIKKIFESPIDEKGKVKWVFVGADFSSLEDRIGALITKDPNKIKVYSGLQQYIINVNGVEHLISEDTLVEYNSIQITGKKLYEILTYSSS